MSTINATTSGLLETADSSGTLNIQTNSVTAISVDIYKNVTFGNSGTNVITVPSGTTAQRPTPVNGMIRYNTTTNKLEAYAGGTWQDII